MITSLTFNSVASQTLEINNDIYPANLFDPTIEQRVNKDRKKMQAHGTNPTFTYRDGMEIHVEGAILADDSDDYNAKRIELVYKLFGAPTDPVADRKMGDLVVHFDGNDEDWTTEVTIDAFSAPLAADSPNYTLYLVTFWSWTPYFIGVDSGDKFYYA